MARPEDRPDDGPGAAGAGVGRVARGAVRAIDLHAHLLPGIDDGPATLEEAVALARATLDAGVSTVVATPHVSSGHPNRPATIARALDILREALADAGVPLRVHAGAEVAMDLALALPPGELRRLTLAGGPYLLLESPLGDSALDAELVVEAIHAQGLRVLLAHPERCRPFQRDALQLERLVAQGALTAVTASAFAGAFGRSAQHAAERMLRGGLVHTLVSDMHDRVHRPPGIAMPQRAGGDDARLRAARFAWMVAEVPAAILAGETIPPGPAPPPEPCPARGPFARARSAVRQRVRAR